MEQVLIKFQCDYSDEFDVYGLYVMDKPTWQEFLGLVEKAFKHGLGEREFYFGTNEFLMFETFENFKNCFSVQSIKVEDAKLIENRIGRSFGFNIITVVADCLDFFETVEAEL